MTTPIRLQKLLAQMGLASRREVERWINAGRIQVEDHIAKLGEQVTSDAKIFLDGKALSLLAHKPQPLPSSVWIYHKPVGEICSRSDPEQRKTVFEHLPTLVGQRWISVGRLDLNTSGLLLFTTDGELAKRLMHPSSRIMRTYHVRIYGQATAQAIRLLTHGVKLTDGIARFQTLTHLKGEGANHWYEVSLAEGRNREVRRLWESQGLKINRLIRVSFGSVTLPASLLPKQGKILIKDINTAVISKRRSNTRFIVYKIRRSA